MPAVSLGGRCLSNLDPLPGEGRIRGACRWEGQNNRLNACRCINDGLAHAFHDLKQMEREGSGFELL